VVRVLDAYRTKTVAALLVTAIALSACATSAPKDTFGLTGTAPVAGPSRKARQVLIANPVAVQMLDSQNVVVHVSGQEYQFLGDSQWSDRLPKLVQLKLAQAFQASGVGRHRVLETPSFPVKARQCGSIH
jgi:cholesterol transport system auxiliary component